MALATTLEPLMAHAGNDFRRALANLRADGFQSVQLSASQPGMRPRELDRSARRELAGLLRRYEMTVAGIDAWIPAGHLADPAHVDRALDAVTRAIEMASELGRCPLSLNLPRALRDASPGSADVVESGAKPVSSTNTTVDVAALIETIAETAARFGVQIADHAVPVQVHEVIGVGIDPVAWLALGQDPVAAVTANASRLVSARLVDLLRTGLRGPIGDPHQGRLDVLAYRATLDVVGYRRPVVIDTRQWADPWSGVRQCAAEWKMVTL